MWSVGVLLFILLSGRPPFDGQSDEEIFRAVKAGRICYDEPLWQFISLEGKVFLGKLLSYYPRNRIEAFHALEQDWFYKLEHGGRSGEQQNLNVMTKIKSFNGRMKLQQAALAFVVDQMLTEQEKINMKKIFESLDKNLDGSLSKQEVAEGLERLGTANPMEAADQIFRRIDLDDDGSINFEEWCTATMNKRKVLNKSRLQQAYNFLDKDGNGHVDYQEIRDMFKMRGYTFEEQDFQKFIHEVDIDGNRLISFEEFEIMMQMLCKK